MHDPQTHSPTSAWITKPFQVLDLGNNWSKKTPILGIIARNPGKVKSCRWTNQCLPTVTWRGLKLADFILSSEFLVQCFGWKPGEAGNIARNNFNVSRWKNTDSWHDHEGRLRTVRRMKVKTVWSFEKVKGKGNCKIWFKNTSFSVIIIPKNRRK